MARRVAAASAVAALAAACSGGGGSSSHASAPPAARQQGALAAAKACRMWTELFADAVKEEPLTPAKAQPLDARSAQIMAPANAASDADPAWNDLATDVAGATDFASAALPDINTRIVKDCAQVPADARAAEAAQPDPFATTTTTG